MTETRPKAARKRGVIRLELNVLQNPRVEQLSDDEFRAYVSLLPWVARYSDNADGEIPREWLETFAYGHTDRGRSRRITEKPLVRLVESGLVEVFEYDDGTQTVAIVGWRDFRPIDMTSAERKRRFRRRLYGGRYYGTTGEVCEVQLPSDDEVAALEAEGHAILEDVERRGVAAVLGDPHTEPENVGVPPSSRTHGSGSSARADWATGPEPGSDSASQRSTSA